MEEFDQTAARNPYAPPEVTVADVAPSEARHPRPATVSWAVALLWLDLARTLAQRFLTWQPSGEPWVQGAGTCIALAIVVCLIYQISVGRNWARWVVLVVMTFEILSTSTRLRQILAYYSHASHAVTVLWAVGMALEVVATCLLFVPPGRQWFRRPHEPALDI